jgi:cyclic pyranopterin phosphate synthase
MGAKRTAELVPLCHQLPLTKVEVRIALDDELPGFRIEGEVRTKAETGVEMEALTAVAVAGLTLFDMMKGVDRTMVIGGIEVVSKTGGKSGSWAR